MGDYNRGGIVIFGEIFVGADRSTAMPEYRLEITDGIGRPLRSNDRNIVYIGILSNSEEIRYRIVEYYFIFDRKDYDEWISPRFVFLSFQTLT